MTQKSHPVAVRALDLSPPAKKSGYPEPFASRVAGREKRRLGDPFGLTDFGVNLCRLEPGAQSSMRHAHSHEDEFVYILEGSPTLITDEGATILSAGMCAGFKAGSGNAHHLRNDSPDVAWYFEVGTRAAVDHVVYPDDDLALHEQDGRYTYTHKNGDPYPAA